MGDRRVRSAPLSASPVAARATLDPGQQVVQDVLRGGLVGRLRPTDVAGPASPVHVHQPADPVPAEVARPQVTAVAASGLVGRPAGIRAASGFDRTGRLSRRWMGYH